MAATRSQRGLFSAASIDTTRRPPVDKHQLQHHSLPQLCLHLHLPIHKRQAITAHTHTHLHCRHVRRFEAQPGARRIDRVHGCFRRRLRQAFGDGPLFLRRESVSGLGEERLEGVIERNSPRWSGRLLDCDDDISIGLETTYCSDYSTILPALTHDSPPRPSTSTPTRRYTIISREPSEATTTAPAVH